MFVIWFCAGEDARRIVLWFLFYYLGYFFKKRECRGSLFYYVYSRALSGNVGRSLIRAIA